MPVKIDKKKSTQESHTVLAGLKKTHGDQVGAFGDEFAPVGRVATGIFPLDLALGGGFPLWRISIPWGPESSGKTTTALKLLASVQRQLKRTAVLIDAEHVYDKAWSAKHGVLVDKLILVQPDNGEQGVDAVEGFMNSDDVGIVVLDSLPALQPQKWIEAEAGTQQVGGNTQIVSNLINKVGVALTKQQKRDNPILFVLLNQMRFKVAVKFADPETMPGGMSVKHASSLTIRYWSKKIYDKKISEDMPSHLEHHCVIRKWRIPIIGTNCQYDMCLVPHDDYKVGDIMNTWKTVAHRLQASGDLVKTGKLWLCVGEEAPTLDLLEHRYRTDPMWQMKLQKRVLENASLILPPKENTV